MTSKNHTSLPDAALAELDRLHAAANGHTLRLASFSGAKIETDSSPTGYVGVCVWRSDAESFIALHSAYPSLRQRLLDAESRLAQAERERDELRMKLRVKQTDLENMAIKCGQAEGLLRKERDERSARDEAAEAQLAVASNNARHYADQCVELEAQVAVLRGALETLNHAAKVAISTEYGGCLDEETPLVIRLLDGTCDETDTALALTPASAGNWIKAEAYREAARLVDSCSAETLHREADRMEKEGANGR